jgi:hypothetical protein
VPVSPGQMNPARRSSACPVAESLVTLREGAHILDMRSRPSLYILLDMQSSLVGLVPNADDRELDR